MEKPIPVSQPFLSDKEERYVLDAVRSGWVSSKGAYIDRFEQGFADYCGVKFAIAVSNGTTGLHLALAALGIGQGYEVIVPDLTFIATANAVAYTGAKPVLVDIDPDTLGMSVDAARGAITPRTKAIMPVHLYGHPADMDPLRDLAREHNLRLIEDAAEAHGATYRGVRVGGLGDCGVFSFYGNKIITTGEGGMLTTNDPELNRRARILRDHAMDPSRRYWHLELGYNYRMTNIQAALGVAQLEQIDAFLQRRTDIAQWYRQYVDTSNSVRLNHQAVWATSAYWMICLEVDWFNASLRDKFMAFLAARGIDSRPYFHTISEMGLYQAGDNPIAAAKSVIGVNLPTYFELTEADVRRVAEAVNQGLRVLSSQAAA